MEFSEQYLTYEEYKALGGTLDLTSFNLLEFEARNQIDIRTQNRLKNETDIPQKVKICDYRLIEQLNNYSKSLNKIASKGDVASENTDGYSVSYVTPSQIQEIVKSNKVEIDDLIMTDLYGVVVNNKHIIYNGVN